jgi:hypothetical protein
VQTTPTFAKTFQKDDRTRRFEIVRDAVGWRVRQSQDSTVVRNTLVTDWHRVERARRAFVLEMSALRDEGWIERA